MIGYPRGQDGAILSQLGIARYPRGISRPLPLEISPYMRGIARYPRGIARYPRGLPVTRTGLPVIRARSQYLWYISYFDQACSIEIWRHIGFAVYARPIRLSKNTQKENLANIPPQS